MEKGIKIQVSRPFETILGVGLKEVCSWTPLVVLTCKTAVPQDTVNKLKKTKDYFWENSTPSIMHETLCNDYEAGALKHVDILNKIMTF